MGNFMEIGNDPVGIILWLGISMERRARLTKSNVEVCRIQSNLAREAPTPHLLWLQNSVVKSWPAHP